MCRPDDFPPYPEAVQDDPDAVLQPQGMFRSLDPEEQASFRSWARANWQPGQPINALWHPVVRDECRIMEQERR
jgi:hypothetical protein